MGCYSVKTQFHPGEYKIVSKITKKKIALNKKEKNKLSSKNNKIE